MPAPTVYTEKSLAEFMHSELGGIAGVLKLAVGDSDAGSYSEAVNSTLLVYGANTITDATDIVKLRSLATIEAWKLAVKGLTGMYDFAADGGNYKRSQLQLQAKVALDDAVINGMQYLPGYEVTVVRSVPVNDPYRYTPLDEQTL